MIRLLLLLLFPLSLFGQTTLDRTVTISAAQEAVLTATAKGTAPFKWQWYKDGARISGATTASYATKLPGVYSVNAENSAGWAASNKVTVIVLAPTPTPSPTPSPTPTPTPTPAVIKPSEVLINATTR